MPDNLYQRYLRMPKGYKRYYEFSPAETCSVAVVQFLKRFPWFVQAFEAMDEDERNSFMEKLGTMISLSS